MKRKLYLDKLLFLLLIAFWGLSQNFSFSLKIGEGTGIGINKNYERFFIRTFYLHHYLFSQDKMLLGRDVQIYVPKKNFFTRAQSLEINLCRKFPKRKALFYIGGGFQLRYKPGVYYRKILTKNYYTHFIEEQEWNKGWQITFAPGINTGVEVPLSKKLNGFAEIGNYFEMLGFFVGEPSSIMSTRRWWIFPQISLGINYKLK